jgi:2,3-bisphosphoglycerate-independent phosphoglycerate mutase
VRESYGKDKTPDDVTMFDEYIPPYCINGYRGVQDGDCIMHTNYRQDRAIQLSMAFVDEQYPGKLARRPDITYLGFTQYYDEFQPYLLDAMSSGGSMTHLLGEMISRAGLKQLRLAETQKFRHVTSFFNGKATTPYPGEDQVEIKSKLDPASFASHPEMEAHAVTEKALELLQDNPYGFILINYANGDMVGHTGDFEAAKKAIGIVDECLGRIVPRLLQLDGRIFITADHGNSEQMIDYETGMPKTSHTTFPVECIYVSRDLEQKSLIPRGKLSDIAPTVLELLGLDVPTQMTARSLFG